MRPLRSRHGLSVFPKRHLLGASISCFVAMLRDSRTFRRQSLCYAVLGPFFDPAVGYKLGLQCFWENRIKLWCCVKPDISTSHHPLLSLPQPPGRMRNNGLVSAGIYLGWWGLPTQTSQSYQPKSRESGSDTALLLLWLCVLSTSSFYWFCFSLDAAYLGQGHRELASQRCLKDSSALTSDLWWKLISPRNQE